MKIAAKSAHQQANGEKLKALFLFLAAASLLAISSTLLASVDTPPRLFFSDAKLSYLVPEPWDVPDSFPFGPLLTRKTPEGSDAYIVCQISKPIDQSRLSADRSTDTLKTFATQDIHARAADGRILASSARAMSGQNAWEMTWIVEHPEGATQYQSVYFYLENRFYVMTLQTTRDSFPGMVPSFQEWLTSVHLLSRRDSGKLEAPSLGGLWVHQTGGAKISIPETWLIGVADDRQLGATIARDKMTLSFTVVVDAVSKERQEVPVSDKAQARKALEEKGHKILDESDEPFHGLPAFRMAYDGTIDGKYIRGQDLWIMSPTARWLINIEGDGRLIRSMSDEWQGILNGIHFYP